jgi:transglutaminase-like putative cysteine protease
MAAPRASVAVSVTRAGLTVAAAFALTRVFAGRSWLLAMIVAAVVPPLLLAWAERDRWAATLRVGVVTVVGIWLAAFVAEPSTTILGVPTRATIGSLGSALGDAPHTLRSAVVPVAPTGAALVLAFVSVYVAAVLTHWIATSLEAPIGAFAPSIALFIVVAAVGEGSWVASTALYALTGLAYLLSLAQNDLLARRTWFHASAPHAPRVAAGGALVGAIAVIAALVAGPSVPGADGAPLIDYRKLGDGRGSPSLLEAAPPILTLRDKLQLDPVQELFTVSAERPAYWRVIALDWFTNGQAWGIKEETQESIAELDAPLDLPRSEALHQRFQIANLDPHWLPAAYRPVGINLTAARFVPESMTLFVESRGELTDLIYDIDSRVPTPAPAELARAPEVDPTEFERQLELPSDFSQPVRELAASITANARSPYERAVALLQFFRNGNFTYSLDTNLGDSPDAITEFLLKERTGFCEQFAASYAALARVVGLPSRVAVGYQPGTLGPDGLWHVTNRNAHAWPEVWIEGAGWLPFEPTPPFNEPTNGLGTGGPAPPSPGPTASTSTTAPSVTAAPQFPTFPRTPNSFSVVPPPAQSSGRDANPVVTGFFVVAGALLLGVLAFAAYAAYTLWRRRQRRRHAKDPRRRVLGAWNEALDHLRTAGVPPKPAATSLEFATRYAPAHGAGTAGGPALLELARLQSAAMYADEPPTADDASYAWEQADSIRDMVRRTIARPTRWRRRLQQVRRSEPSPAR